MSLYHCECIAAAQVIMRKELTSQKHAHGGLGGKQGQPPHKLGHVVSMAESHPPQGDDPKADAPTGQKVFVWGTLEDAAKQLPPSSE